MFSGFTSRCRTRRRARHPVRRRPGARWRPPAPGKRPVTAQDAGHVRAVDEAHVDVELPIDPAEVVNRRHVRFLQPSGGAGLALHARAEDRVVGRRLGHQLQRDDPLAHGVLGLVDVAHATATDQAPQPIRSKLRTLPRTRVVSPIPTPCRRSASSFAGGGVPGIRLMASATPGAPIPATPAG